MKLTASQWVVFVFVAVCFAVGMARAGIDNVALLILVPLIISAAICALLNYVLRPRPKGR